MDDILLISCPACDTQNRVPAARIGDKPKCGVCQQQLFSAHPVNLTSASFERHIRDTTIPIVVDFWAPWCGPCKTMALEFEKAAAQLEPRVRFAKVNTDSEQAIAVRFGISAIPTLIIFKNGSETGRQAGAMNSTALVEWIRSQI
jgi:thioredoxin 2